MPKPIKSAGLIKKVRRYFKLRDQAKAKYATADSMLIGIRKRVKPNQPILVDEVPFAVFDNFADDDTVFRAHGIHRYELRRMKPEEFEKATA